MPRQDSLAGLENDCTDMVQYIDVIHILLYNIKAGYFCLALSRGVGVRTLWRRIMGLLRLDEPSSPVVTPLSLEDVPGIWFQRSAGPGRDVLRVFLAGNPSLNTREYVFLLQESLKGLMAQRSIAEANMEVRVYENYIAIEDRSSGVISVRGATIILADEFVHAAVQMIAGVLWWENVPTPVEFETHRARTLADQKLNWRWPPGGRNQYS